LINFIEQLPELEEYTDILVVVDQLTKQVVFMPIHKTINTKGLAKLFVTHVFSKHGIPNHVTSDKGVEFVLYFFML